MGFKYITFLITVLLIGQTLANPDTVLLLTSQNHKQVKNLNELKEHLTLQNQENVQAFTVSHDLTISQLLKQLQNVLQSKDFAPESVSSFNILQKVKAKTILKDKDSIIEQISLKNFDKLLEKFAHQEGLKNLVILFDSKDERILQGSQPTSTPSQLFINMTPSTLSGLFVGLFLIIVLLIGVSCLYDIKTNDKFARQQLWIGKEN